VWIVSEDKHSLECLLRLHNKIYAQNKIKTYMMGYTYDANDDFEDDQDEEEDLAT
jgi:hypothetical protein